MIHLLRSLRCVNFKCGCKKKIDDSYQNVLRREITVKDMGVRAFLTKKKDNPYKNCRQPVVLSAHYMPFGQMSPGVVDRTYAYTRGKLRI